MTVLIYALILLIGAARQTGNPSLISMLPSAVPRDQYPRAIAISSSAQKFAQVVGPLVGGFGYALIGHGIFWFNPVLPLAALIAVSLMKLPPQKIEPRSESSPTSRTLAGFSYIRSNRLLLGLLSLDLFAVLFGGVTALLPIFAADVLHVGSTGLGMLAAATPVGAVAMGLSLAYIQMNRNAGPIMMLAVTGYGLAIVTFGFSTNFLLSLLALTCSGACDITGTVIRQTIIQTTTPDAMRGRVSAVNMVFSGTSNQLGNFESGIVAGLIGAVPAAIVGGLGTLTVVAAFVYLFPEIRRNNQIYGGRVSSPKDITPVKTLEPQS
jgi:MFS family permease